MTVKLEMINNKPFLRMTFHGSNIGTVEELAKVYDWKGQPYIRRLRQRMNLTVEMIKGETVII